MVRFLAVMLALMAFAGTALHAQHVWTGATSTAWNTASNWSAGTVPTNASAVIIPDTTALPNQPTLSTTATCNNLTIEAGGVLNGSNGTLAIFGNWTNNGTFVPNTSIVHVQGSTVTSIGGAVPTTFNRLLIQKTARTIDVNQTADLTITFTGTSTGTPALDIRQGTFRNNGNNLSVANGVTGSTTPAAGELHISGGTCLFGIVYQFSAIKQFTVTGGNTTITGQHSIVNSGHRFNMSGGTVTYTSTANDSVRCLSNNGVASGGWFVTAGEVFLHGGLQSATSNNVFQATGTSIVRFVGSANITCDFCATSTAGNQNINLQDVRIEKTGGASVTFSNTQGNINNSQTIGALSVSPTSSLVFGPANMAANQRWNIASINNSGTATLTGVTINISGDITNSGTFNIDGTGTKATPVSLNGNITNSGTFTTHPDTQVTLTGTTARTISGDTTFHNLDCLVPGRRINIGAGDTLTITGLLLLEGSAGSKIELRSTSGGNEWFLQRNGNVVARHCDVQDSNASGTVYAQPGGVDSGNNTNWIFGGSVSVVAASGPRQAVWANDTSGLVSGTFVLNNDAASSVTLNSLSLTASGSGNDALAYSEVAVYVDHPSSGTPGSFDAADTLYAAAVTAFPADDGTLTFTSGLSLAAGSDTRFFVVVKFDGADMAVGGETFGVNVSALNVTGAPTSNVPSSDMPGHIINQVILNVTFPVTTSRPMARTYEGPNNDGFVFDRFQVVNNSPIAITVNQFSLEPSSTSVTTAPLTLFTSVELFEDTNNSGNWERAHDTQVGATFTSWTTILDFLNTVIGPNETKLYFVVVKLNGTGGTSGSYRHTFLPASSAVKANFTGTIGTFQTRMSIVTTSLYTVAEPGTVVDVVGTDTNQHVAGTFVIHNTSLASSVTLNSISLTSSGTGFDNTGYSQVAIYRDSNASGDWDAGDALAATAITAFPSNNGAATFTLTTPLAIAGAASERFFVVVRMGGATTPLPTHTFMTRVTAITSSVTSDGSGLPSAIMAGIEILGERLRADATAGTAVSVLSNSQGPGGNGIEAGTFTITNDGVPASVDLLSITLRASGTADDSTAYDEVAIYRDSAAGAVGSFDFANDILIGTAAAAFPNDNGTLTFNVQASEQLFAGGEVKTYFVVAKLNGTATASQTFQFTVEAMTVAGAATTGGVPTATMAGLVVSAVFNAGATVGTATGVLANATGSGGNGVQAGVFTINTGAGGGGDLLSLTITASGTGNDNTAFSEVAIYRDSASGTVGSFDFANDILIGSTAATFPSDNGSLTFNVQASEQTFGASETRTYFVVVKLNGTASVTESFQFQLSNATASPSGVASLPTAVMSGLFISAPFNAGATTGSATGVLANATGPGGNGVQAGTFTIGTGAGGGGDLLSLTITASGSGNDNTAYSEVAIYRDSASGTVGSFDFANDILIGSAAATFPSDNGALTFNVQAPQQTFGASETRTYFVVVKLNGSATVGQTFQYQLTGVTASPSGVGGLPTAVMAGIVVTSPFTAAATVGSAQQVYANATGTGANGVQAGVFEFTCAVGGSANLLSITVTAGGSGNDNTAYSEVAIYRDGASGSVGSFDFANDTLIGSPATAFPSDNGSLTFNVQAGQQAFAAGESRTYFVVVKLAGTATPGQTFQYTITGISSSPTGVTGIPTATMLGLTVVPPFTASATPGTVLPVYAGATGTGGNGVQAGVFTIGNGPGAASLLSVTITASGSGNDNTAYSEVAIYRDGASGSVGSFDFANDILIGSPAAAFPSDNGSLTFNLQAGQQAFAAGESRTYFVVVKLNGSAANAQTFQYTVTGVSSSPAGVTGIPTATMVGLTIEPEFSLAAAAGTPLGVFANGTGAGGNGIQAGVFTIQAGSLGANLVSITVASSGTGNDSTAYSEVAIYRDAASGTVGSFDFANDIPIGTAATAFPADNGALTFTVQGGEQAFGASETRTYFVVVKLNATAATGHTFQYTITGLSPASSGTPSTLMSGLVIDAPTFTIADTSPATQTDGYAGTGGNVVQRFTVVYPDGQDNTLTSIEFTGTAAAGGNLATDVTQVDLYRDDNANGVYDAGVDVLVDSQTAFGGTNQVTFTLTGAESQFAAGDSRQYFVVLEFSATTPHQSEFATQLTAASGAATGTNINGVPAPVGGATAGLLVLANSLFVAVNGPAAAITVDSNSQGPGGLGHVIWDGTLSTQAVAWTVSGLVFEGTGTADHETAYSFLALYEDTNASGTFDAGDQLAVAVAGTSFNGSYQYTATLTDPDFPATTNRRFFLVGRLAGTATFGETLNARLTGVQATPPSGGQVAGDINVDSTALIIDAAAITVGNGPTPPVAALLKAGTAQAHVLAKFRFTASNSDVTVTSVTLTTAGTGNWVTDLSNTNGVEMWEDNGDGTFNAASDTLIFQGAGAASINAAFTTPLQIANASSKDVWVRLNLLATGGSGAATPITFSLSIANAADVQAGAITPLLGTPQPVSSVMSVVDFFVTSFTPIVDVVAGGASITITGSGFVAPVTVTIGGVLCAGVPVITGGTSITGLVVPAGNGTSLPIVVTSGSLPPQTLTQVFNYSTSFGGGGGGSKGGGGCAQSSGSKPWLLLAALVPAALVLRRRRARA